jgi:hypothetical protein
MFVNSEISIPFMITSSHNSIQVDVNHECGAIFSIGGDPAVSALCPGNKGFLISSSLYPCLLQKFEDYHPQFIQNLLPNRNFRKKKQDKYCT